MKILFPKIYCAGIRGAKEVARRQLGYKKRENNMIKLTDKDKRYLLEGIARDFANNCFNGDPYPLEKSDLLKKLNKMYDLVMALEKENII